LLSLWEWLCDVEWVVECECVIWIVCCEVFELGLVCKDGGGVLLVVDDWISGVLGLVVMLFMVEFGYEIVVVVVLGVVVDVVVVDFFDVVVGVLCMLWLEDVG